ncbi:type 4b pilus protein PilO2 [Scandinavium goeteborgense]|uniref:type 4b pilus protein PilO2 n=1 Tax=Scandinavium goeteborgense TaxID=1851514 RepID=UPI003817856A
MARLIKHGRLNALAGMHWQFVAQTRIRALRVLARNEDATRFVVVPSASSEGVLLGCDRDAPDMPRRGLPVSLALLVLPALKRHGDSGVAIVPLDENTWWFVAITQGELSVLSDITGSKSRVLAAIDDFYRFQPRDDGFCLAPEGFLPDRASSESSLAALLDDSPSSLIRRFLSARLRPVSTQKTNARIGLAAVVCLAAWLGWQHWQTVKEHEQETAAHNALLQARQARLNNAKNVTNPWQTLAAPAEVLTSCRRQWSRLPLSIAGWVFSVSECGSDGKGHTILMSRYKRPRNETVGDFAARLPVYYPQTPVFDIPGPASTAQFIQAVSVPVPKKNDRLLKQHALLLWMTSYAQKLHADLSIQPKARNTKVPLPYLMYAWSLKTDIPPDNLALNALPDGVRVSKVSMTLAQARLHYILQGELYAHR